MTLPDLHNEQFSVVGNVHSHISLCLRNRCISTKQLNLNHNSLLQMISTNEFISINNFEVTKKRY